MQTHVLQLDIQGTPQAWIALEQAALHYATGTVAWHVGSGPLATLRGGWNSVTGRQSLLQVHPIVAVRGHSRVNLFDRPVAVSKEKLLRRDRHTCAYCGEVHDPRLLQAEHIVPESRGGAYAWMNLVTACALSPPKTSPVGCVSEFRRRGGRGKSVNRTGSHYQFWSRVRGRSW